MTQTASQEIITSQLSALELATQIQSGQITAKSLVDQSFGVIEQTDKTLGAFLSLSKDLAYEMADSVDQKAKAGEKLPLLAGVPIGVKDNIMVQDLPTTCASKILENFVAPYDSTITGKLKAHGLPIVGKTNLDEFAMGSSTENSALQVTRNPWDTERVPGGSSGGSAVCVSAGQTLLSLGSDTGGSVRQPASFCGISGLKPTYGLVSRYGLVAFGSSLDQISPFARNTHDMAALMNIITGFDQHDSTSVNNEPVDYLKALDTPLDIKRIGYIEELMSDAVQPDVREAIKKSLEAYEGMGIATQPVSIPHIKYAVAVYYIVATAEASSNLARYDGIRFGLRDMSQPDLLSLYRHTRDEGFGAEVKRRIILGTFALSSGYADAYYGKATAVRELLRKDFSDVFKQVDVVACPTVPTTAFKIGELVNDPLQMYLSDIATIPINMAGIPGMSVPCGFDQNGLPIGLQLMGPHFSEAKLLQTALAFEKASGLKNLQPVL